MGHEERFPLPMPNGRYRFRKRSLCCQRTDHVGFWVRLSVISGPSLGMHNIKCCDQVLCRMAGSEPHGRTDAITDIGLDVHKETVWVAVAESGRCGEYGRLGFSKSRPEILCMITATAGQGRPLTQLPGLALFRLSRQTYAAAIFHANS
jgi:hypothetical protein